MSIYMMEFIHNQLLTLQQRAKPTTKGKNETYRRKKKTEAAAKKNEIKEMKFLFSFQKPKPTWFYGLSGDCSRKHY